MRPTCKVRTPIRYSDPRHIVSSYGVATTCRQTRQHSMHQRDHGSQDLCQGNDMTQSHDVGHCMRYGNALIRNNERISSTGTQLQHSNCKERGLKCLLFAFRLRTFLLPSSTHTQCPSYSDEFAEVRAVKLLRHGQRLQQVKCDPFSLVSSAPSLRQPTNTKRGAGAQ